MAICLYISSARESTTSRYRLFHFWTILTINFFLVSSLFPSHLYPLFFVAPLQKLNNSVLSSWQSFSHMETNTMSCHSLLFSSKSYILLPDVPHIHSRAFVSLVTFFWKYSSLSLFLKCCVWKWNLYCRCGLTNTKYM